MLGKAQAEAWLTDLVGTDTASHVQGHPREEEAPVPAPGPCPTQPEGSTETRGHDGKLQPRQTPGSWRTAGGASEHTPQRPSRGQREGIFVHQPPISHWGRAASSPLIGAGKLGSRPRVSVFILMLCDLEQTTDLPGPPYLQHGGNRHRSAPGHPSPRLRPSQPGLQHPPSRLTSEPWGSC